MSNRVTVVKMTEEGKLADAKDFGSPSRGLLTMSGL